MAVTSKDVSLYSTIPIDAFNRIAVEYKWHYHPDAHPILNQLNLDPDQEYAKYMLRRRSDITAPLSIKEKTICGINLLKANLDTLKDYITVYDTTLRYDAVTLDPRPIEKVPDVVTSVIKILDQLRTHIFTEFKKQKFIGLPDELRTPINHLFAEMYNESLKLNKVYDVADDEYNYSMSV